MAETERIDQPKQASQDEAPRMDCPTCHVSHVGPTAEALRSRLSSVERDERVERLWSAVPESSLSTTITQSPNHYVARAGRLAGSMRYAGPFTKAEAPVVRDALNAALSGGAVPSPDGPDNDGTKWGCSTCGSTVTGPSRAPMCPKGCHLMDRAWIETMRGDEERNGTPDMDGRYPRRGSPDGGDLPAPRRGSPEWLTGEVGDLQRHYYGTPPGDWATAWDLFKRAMRLLLGALPAPREDQMPWRMSASMRDIGKRMVAHAEVLDDALLGSSTPPGSAAAEEEQRLLGEAADLLRAGGEGLAALAGSGGGSAPDDGREKRHREAWLILRRLLASQRPEPFETRVVEARGWLARQVTWPADYMRGGGATPPSEAP